MEYPKKTINPQDLSRVDRHQLLLGAIAPRPIAFVSSYNEARVANLAPYSFFMGISTTPPIVAFSAAFKGGDRPEKDSLHNALLKKELVINVVSAEICKAMTLTSIMYPPEVSEFDVAGFTIVPADLIDAPMVAESPINMECKVLEVKNYGDHPGAGNLVVCEVVRFHVDPSVLGDKDRIDPDRVRLMGRMGRAFYTRAYDKSIATYYQKVDQPVIGMHNIPEHILKGDRFSREELLLFAALPELPDEKLMSLWKAKAIKEDDPFAKVRGLMRQGHIEQAFAMLLGIPEDEF